MQHSLGLLTESINSVVLHLDIETAEYFAPLSTRKRTPPMSPQRPFDLPLDIGETHFSLLQIDKSRTGIVRCISSEGPDTGRNGLKRH